MPVPGSRSGALPPPPRLPQPRNVDDLIRDLQRINLSQCLDQLNTDINQLSHMEHQLGSWSGLYVRCPDPEPDDLGQDPADKKSSSGYSTESASPPESRDISDEAAGHGACADGGCCETEVKRPLSDDYDAGFVREFGDLAGDRPRYHSVRLLGSGGGVSGPLKLSSPRVPAGVDGFRPAAASTPAPACAPRSPKTLRFAATAELIAPDSPSRRQVASGAPRPGILRRSGRQGSAAGAQNRQVTVGGVQNRQVTAGGSQNRHVTVGGSQNRQVTVGGVQNRQGAQGSVQSRHVASDDTLTRRRESAERVSRAVSALSRLEAELNGSAGRTYGTGQFVSPVRRRGSPGPAPPPPLDPLVLVRTATDTEESDAEDTDLPPPPPPPPADTSEHDLVRWRRTKPAPPPPQLRPPRRRLAWLLSCASRRRRPSPPSAYLGVPPAGAAPPAVPAPALFKCNLCKARFPEHLMLVTHVHERHVRVQVRPKYSCGLCPARFYASRFLAKHCSYHHATMGDRRTPQCLKIRRIV